MHTNFFLSMILGLIDSLILTACQPVYGCVYLEVIESRALCVHIYVFSLDISKNFLFHTVLSNTNNFQTDIFCL